MAKGQQGRASQPSSREEEKAQALMVVQPPRLPMPTEAAREGLSEGQWKALVDAVFPSAKSVDGVLLAVRYARARGLDVFKRVVHVVPMWNSALGREVETVWPGIAEIRTTASRTGLHAGNDDCQFGPVKKTKFHDKRTRQGRNNQEYVDEEKADVEYPEWAQITVYKMVQGQRVAFVGPKVWFVETFSGIKGMNVPNARWQRAPRQMLEKCAEAAALRRAFPDELGDTWSAEEMEGKDWAAGSIEGEYAVVGEEEKPQQEARPTRQKAEAPQETPEERRRREYWGPSGLSEFIAYCQEGFSQCRSLEAVDRAYAAEVAPHLENLPEADRRTVDGYAEAARERIREAGDAGGVSDVEQSDESMADVHQRYLEQLERFARDVSTPVDVNSLRAREKQSIGMLPDGLQEQANIILDVAMAVAKGQGDFDALLAERRPGEAQSPAAEGKEQ